jgi:hypothetical protein
MSYTFSKFSKNLFKGYIGCTSIYGLINGIQLSNSICFTTKNLDNTEFIFEVMCYSYITTSTIITYTIFSPLLIPYTIYNKINKSE